MTHLSAPNGTRHTPRHTAFTHGRPQCESVEIAPDSIRTANLGGRPADLIRNIHTRSDLLKASLCGGQLSRTLRFARGGTS